MITSALINLGLSQGSHVFESLGDAVGISGLGFESSQLVVSGYVLPGLKVKYASGFSIRLPRSRFVTASFPGSMWRPSAAWISA